MACFYECAFSSVKRLPQVAKDAEALEQIAAQYGYRAEVMTDQIDLYRKGGRKVATYMTADDDDGLSPAKVEIAKAWGDVLNVVGYVQNSFYNLDTQKAEVAQKIGRALFDYMTSAQYDCDWEGFSDDELKGIAALMRDFSLAVTHT